MDNTKPMNAVDFLNSKGIKDTIYADEDEKEDTTLFRQSKFIQQ